MQQLAPKAALLFPGLDALFMSSKLQRWLADEKVCETLKEASGLLSEITGAPEDLAEFIRVNKRLHLADFDRTLVALTALQVGITRQLRVHWDIAQGCSHGDVARSVICESLSFRDAIDLLWTFGELRKTCPKGYTANVRARDGSPLTAEQIQWLKDSDTPVSLWSDTNATIGGSVETLEKIIQQCESKGLKVKPVLPYPVHSPAMRPSMEELRAKAGRWTIRAPNKPVFSSLWIRYLETPQDIFEEGLASAVQEVRWTETLAHLHEKEGVNTFINVGPSNTLTGWLFSSPKFEGVKLLDGWELLHGPEEA
jgi:[acyl-carrier-protein] S-malonyltransferase